VNGEVENHFGVRFLLVVLLFLWGVGKMVRRTDASPRSIGHPPHSSASPVELFLRVGPRVLSGKKGGHL